MEQQPRSSSVVIEVKEASKVFPDSGELVAISDISLSLYRGEFLCILGPSGCGKTTLLRMMAGLLLPSSGTILLDDKQVNGPQSEVVLLFQDYSRSLLPWRRVLQNVELGLEANEVNRGERRTVARKFLQLVGLSGFENHFPWQLSGGMQQRVALARALACTPKVLLLDEPFGSLDALTREELEDELLRLWFKLKVSVVFVTHDIEEAVYLGQRIAVLTERPGRIQTVKEVVLDYPRNQLVTRQTEIFLKLRSELRKALRVK